MQQTRLVAKDHVDPTLPAEESARRLADIVVTALATADHVTIDFGGVRGVASSFYNVLLSRIAATLGSVALTERLSYDLHTTTHRMIFDRSLAAFRRAAG